MSKGEKRKSILDAFLRQIPAKNYCLWSEESALSSTAGKSVKARRALWAEVERTTVLAKPVLQSLSFPYSTAWEILRGLGADGILSIFRFLPTGEADESIEEELVGERDEIRKGANRVLRVGIPSPATVQTVHPELVAGLLRRNWVVAEGLVGPPMSDDRTRESHLPTMSEERAEIRRSLLEAGIDFYHFGKAKADWDISRTIGFTAKGLKATFFHGGCLHTLVLEHPRKANASRSFFLILGRQAFAPSASSPSWKAFRNYLTGLRETLHGVGYAYILNNDYLTRGWCFSPLLAKKSNGKPGGWPGQLTITIDPTKKLARGSPLAPLFRPIKVVELTNEQASGLPNHMWQMFSVKNLDATPWTEIIFGDGLKWQSYADGSFAASLPFAIQIGKWQAVIHCD